MSHACIGVSTTLTLGETVVAQLARGYDWKIVEDGPPEFNRYHWQPSRRLRVSVQPRSSG